MTTVTLGQLRLRLHTQEAQAETLQHRCSTWFQVRLQPELARLLTDYARADDVPRTLTRLTLNVGDIPLSRFESEMSERIIRQLQQQLLALPVSQWHRGETDATAQAPRSEGITLPADPTTLAASAGETSRTPTRAFEHLLHYLDTGVMADVRGWSRRDVRDAGLGEALDSASSVPAPVGAVPPRIALAWRLLHPRARQRLLMTWPGAPLTRLVTWLIAPTRLPSLTPREASRVLPLAALMALQQYPAAAEWGLPAASAADTQRLAPLFDMHSARPPSAGEIPAGGRENMAPAFPPDTLLDRWLNALLSVPLPAAWRGTLQTCLGDEANRAHLPELSPPVRARLRRALGMTQASLPGAPAPAEPRPPSSPGEAAPQVVPACPVVSASPSAQAMAAPWWVASAGLVLLWPLLPRLFSAFDWLEGDRFIDDAARWQAVGCLDWLAWGDTALPEWRTPCARLLCGIAGEVPFEALPPAPARQAELDTWLGQAFAGVAHLERCSVSDLRTFFLQRDGILTADEPAALSIAPEATDVLLHHLPWPLTHVVLPWRTTFINVDWNA